MASPGSIYLDISVNYDGVFDRPINYTAGLKKTVRVRFDDVAYESFIIALRKFIGRRTFNVYYLVPGKRMCGGLRMLKCDQDLTTFVEHGLKANGKISIYVDMYDDDLSEFIGEDRPTDEPIRGDKGKLKVVTEESSGKISEDDSFDDSLDLELDDFDDIRKFKQTEEDVFLTKMCLPEEREDNVHDYEEDNDVQDEGQVRVDELQSSDDDENGSNTVSEGNIVYPVFDPDMDWKSMKPVLGLRFENATQLRHCLTCYAVANGYQLCYVKAESSRVVVKCGNKKDGFSCSFSLRASWRNGEKGRECFQIKCLNDMHQGAKNYSHGSLVNSAWIGKMYMRELVENPNIKFTDMQRDILDKYLVKVSIGQCVRAKKFALNELDGGLIEHYGRVWDYASEIRRSNLVVQRR